MVSIVGKAIEVSWKLKKKSGLCSFNFLNATKDINYNMSQMKCEVTSPYKRKIREFINHVAEEKSTRLFGRNIMS